MLLVLPDGAVVLAVLLGLGRLPLLPFETELLKTRLEPSRYQVCMALGCLA